MSPYTLTLIFDVGIIVIGTGVILNALIQLYIELRTKDAEGYQSYAWHKVTRQLIFLILGVLVVLLRVWYIMLR
ncbi:MAG: hypothetical protein KJO20_06670 [Eudoraea sp.]|nr:hypothetical protein [Eudoraea sp.]